VRPAPDMGMRSADQGTDSLHAAFLEHAHGQGPPRLRAEAVVDVLRTVGLLAPAVEEETLAFVAQSLRSFGSELGWEILEQLRDDVVQFQDCQSMEASDRMARFPRVHMLDSDGATPLEAAVRSGNADSAAALLRYGALPDEPFYDGKTTPLFYACERGDALMAAALVGGVVAWWPALCSAGWPDLGSCSFWASADDLPRKGLPWAVSPLPI